MLQNFEALLQRTRHPIQTGRRGPARLLHRASGPGNTQRSSVRPRLGARAAKAAAEKLHIGPPFGPQRYVVIENGDKGIEIAPDA